MQSKGQQGPSHFGKLCIGKVLNIYEGQWKSLLPLTAALCLKKMNLDEIKLSIGIGDLRFGMTKNSVIDILGDEYDEEIDVYGDVQIEFVQLALQFTFWKEYGFRLGIISTERNNMSLFDHRLLNKSMDDIRVFIKTELDSGITEEDGCIHDDGHNQEWIDVDERNVTFWFRNNKLYSVDCYCEWEDNDTPKWSHGAA